ncbi:Hpt domain-containing protein, partial [Roseofilum sp. BLCC_M91]
MDQEQLDRIMGYFLEEAKDNLRIIEQGLLNLAETVQDSELVNEVFRAAHSIKGGSAMLGASSIKKTSHQLEDYFKFIKDRPTQVNPKLESLLLQVFDGLSELVENLEESEGDSHAKDAEIMASLTPLFESVNQMIAMENNGVDATAKEPRGMFPAIATPSVSSSVLAYRASNLPDPEESAKHLVFQSDVPTQLRQMLEGFKQPDTAKSRKKLAQICFSLRQAGENFDINPWVELVKLAQGAIANRDHLYADLAPIIIKELKSARDLVLAGTPEQIKPSQALLNLQSEPSLTTSPSDAELDTLLRMGTTPPEDTVQNASSKGGRSDNTPPPLDPPRSSSQRIGPEVGLSELSTLADLFEGETSDIELGWETDLSSASLEDTENLDSSEVDDMGDLSDFLVDDFSNERSEKTTDNLGQNLSNNELFNLDSENPEDDLKDLLEIEPTVMSNNQNKPQDPELSDLFANDNDLELSTSNNSNDIDELLQIDIDSSENDRSLEDLDFEIDDTEQTEKSDFNLDFESNSSLEESKNLSEIDNLLEIEEESSSENLDRNFDNFNQLFDDLSGDIETTNSGELESELDVQPDDTSSESDDIFGLEESSTDESLELEDFSDTEELGDLSLTDDSNSESEDIFGLEESSTDESLELEDFSDTEELGDMSLTDDSNSESEDIFGLEEPSADESLELEDFSETEELGDISLTDDSNSESDDIFGLEESSADEALELEDFSDTEELGDMSLTDDSNSESDDIFGLEEPSADESLELEDFSDTEKLGDMSLTDDSNSESDDIFGLEEPSADESLELEDFS